MLSSGKDHKDAFRSFSFIERELTTGRNGLALVRFDPVIALVNGRVWKQNIPCAAGAARDYIKVGVVIGFDAHTEPIAGTKDGIRVNLVILSGCRSPKKLYRIPSGEYATICIGTVAAAGVAGDPFFGLQPARLAV